MSRLDEVLRIVPTAAAAIETARASAAADPTIEMTLSRWRAKVRRLQRYGEHHRMVVSRSIYGDRATSCSASTRVISALPSALEFWAASRRSGLPGHFISTPQFAGMLGAEARDHRLHRRRRLAGRADWRRVRLGAVRCSCGDRRAGGLERVFIFDALDELFDRVVAAPAPTTLGFVALAHTQDKHPGLYAAGVAFDPLTTAITIDPEKRLEAMPGQLGLPSGRRVVGAAVTLANSTSLRRLERRPRRAPRPGRARHSGRDRRTRRVRARDENARLGLRSARTQERHR